MSSGYTATCAAEDMYEAWAWLAVLHIASHSGWTGRLENVAGPPPALKLRRGPGVIYSSTPFTYAVLTTSGTPTGEEKEVEVHLGIKIAGCSGIGHELDVVVVTRDGARRARAAKSHPGRRDVVLQLECKLFSGDLKLPLARQMVGLTVDCMLGARGHLMSRFSASPNFDALLGHYDVSAIYQAYPGQAGEASLLGRILRALEHHRLS